ncbi:MAG: hypothetical protein AB2672_08810 [Candidatus Thiodiazotropha endolucinida]
MTDEKKSSKKKPEQKTTIVEISEDKLKELLSKTDLKLGKDIRVLKGLEIKPGAVVAKQYDR